MTGTQISSDGLTVRQRKVLFRAWHRGTREMDLLLGQFVDAFVARFDDRHLEAIEALIEVPDQDLFAWITAETETPANYDSPVFRALQAFHIEGPGAAEAHLDLIGTP